MAAHEGWRFARLTTGRNRGRSTGEPCSWNLVAVVAPHRAVLELLLRFDAGRLRGRPVTVREPSGRDFRDQVNAEPVPRGSDWRARHLGWRLPLVESFLRNRGPSSRRVSPV